MSESPSSNPSTASGPRLTALLLVLANMMPVAGVVYFGWDTFLIIYLFWCENLIIGTFNLLRMAFASGDGNIASHLVKPFVMACFAAHFGIFTIAHGMMILTLFGEERLGWNPGEFGPDFFGPCFYALVQLWPELGLPFCALMASHLASFVVNYLGHQEYRSFNINDAMTQPYRRVVVLHLTVCFGALVIEGMDGPIGMLVLLVVVKTVADLHAHWKEHRTQGLPAPWLLALLGGKAS